MVQEVDGLRAGKFCTLHLTAQDVHLIAGDLLEVGFTQVALEKFRVRQITAVEAAAGQRLLLCISQPSPQGRDSWDSTPGEEAVNILQVNLTQDGILE